MKTKTLDDIFAELGFPEPPLLMTQRSRPAAPKRTTSYPVGPCGKTTYPSRASAREAIVNRLNKGTGGATHLLAYECKACRGWHMSSRSTDRPHL